MTAAATTMILVTIAIWGAERLMPVRRFPKAAPAREPTRMRRTAGRSRPGGLGPRHTGADAAHWCTALARALRGGSTLRAAIRETAVPAGLAEAIAMVHHGIDRGLSTADALGRAQGSAAELDQVIAVLRVGATTGGPLAEPLDRTASALHDREMLRAERRTQSAQARLSALTLTAMPGIMLVTLLIVSPSTREVVTGPIGWICVPAGAACNLTGWWWMRSILRGPR